MAKRDNVILFLLVLVGSGICIQMLRLGLTSRVETIVFISGIVTVYLTAKENIWNWPIGLINAATMFWLMYLGRLWSDAVLNIIYFVLGVFGWYWWLHGSAERKKIHIVDTPKKQWGPITAIAVLVTGIWTWVNIRSLGSAPFADAALTVVSLVAQYLLTRKYIESWIVWILVDIFYVPLYLWKGFYLTGLLYGIFTLIAYFGLIEWRRLQAVRETGNPEAKARIPGEKLVHGMLVLGVFLAAWMSWTSFQFVNGMPKEHIAMFRGFGEIKARSQLFDFETGKPFGEPFELNHEWVVHLQANALDPLLFRPVGPRPKPEDPRVQQYGPRARHGQLIFEQDGMQPLVYDVFLDFEMELNGKPVSSHMWKKQLEEIFHD